MVSLAALVFTALPPGGADPIPSTDPLDPVRLLGGEKLVYQFDAGDLDTLHYGSILDVSATGAHITATRPYAIGGPRTFGYGLYVYDVNGQRGASMDDPSRFPVPAGDFTLSTWLASNYGSAYTRMLFDVGTADGQTVFQWYMSDYYDYLYVSHPWGGGTTYYLGHRLTDRFAWHHVAVTMEQGELRAYLDGALTLDTYHGNDAVYNASPVTSVTLGDYRTPGYFWTGYVDDFRLYDRALSVDEIDSIRDAPYRMPDLPPEADAGPDVVVACTGPLTNVTLDASASWDPEGAPLSFAWSAPSGASVSNGDAALATAQFALGVHVASVSVSDGDSTRSDDAQVTVFDGAPPVLDVTQRGPGIAAADAWIPLTEGPTVVVGSAVFSAQAFDVCNEVASVTFTMDDGAAFVDTDAPYAFSYAPEGVGLQYRELSVVARDSAGNDSPPVTVDLTVLAAAPRSP